MVLVLLLLTILIALVIRSSFSGKNFRDNFQLLPVSSLNNAANTSDFIEISECPLQWTYNKNKYCSNATRTGSQKVGTSRCRNTYAEPPPDDLSGGEGRWEPTPKDPSVETCKQICKENKNCGGFAHITNQDMFKYAATIDGEYDMSGGPRYVCSSAPDCAKTKDCGDSYTDESRCCGTKIEPHYDDIRTKCLFYKKPFSANCTETNMTDAYIDAREAGNPRTISDLYSNNRT